jgi:2-methylcitrate dehydratase PrpD
MTVLERFWTHVARAYRGNLPGSLRNSARLHLADTVGAWIAASGTPEGRALRRLAANREHGQANPLGERMLDSVALNCALARLSEIDDIHLSSGTTPGALVVPAALTIGGSLGRGGMAIAEAIAVGYDAMARLGAAFKGPWILYRGIWPTYFAAPFAVAAVAARLLDLTEQQAAHALGIAIGLASPAVGRQSGAAMSRWFAIGHAARSGVSAALSAQAGFTADLRIFEGDMFASVYNLSPDLAALVDALDERPVLPEVSFKPWCAARQTMAASQAVMEIAADGVSAAEMKELVVSVPSLYLRMVDHGIVPGDRASHLTSVSYQMALAALAPDAMLEVEQAPDRVPGEIRAFMERIAVRADDELLRHYPGSWPARLEITTPGGRRERLVIHVPGDPQRPFDESQIAEKFRRVSAALLGERAADGLLRFSLAALDEDGGPQNLLLEIERACAVAAGAGRTSL